MKNIGPVSRQWLAEIGVLTLEELRRAGAVPAYRMIHERYPKRASLNLLWALEGAVREIDWRELTPADKDELKRRLNDTPPSRPPLRRSP